MIYDLEKPVLILGTGPSAVEIDEMRNHITCSLNRSSKIMKHTNFWVLNDANFINDFNEEEIKSIDNLVIPEYPHSVKKGSSKPFKDHKYDILTNHLKDKLNIITFKLTTSIEFYNESKISDFIEVKSSGETAIKVLNRMGFHKFILIGFDPEGGRSDKIKGRTVGSDGHLTPICDPPHRYKEAYQRIVTYVKLNKIKCVKLKTKSEILKETDISDIDWNFKGVKNINL